MTTHRSTIETRRLRISFKLPADRAMEDFYASLHPELADLDPLVGEFRQPAFFSIFLKDDGWHIGTCCLYNATMDDVELGIRIFIPEYWGKGLGGEAVEGLVLYAFVMYPHISSVVLKTPLTNPRAIACYHKCGFEDYMAGKIDGIDMVFMRRQRK